MRDHANDLTDSDLTDRDLTHSNIEPLSCNSDGTGFKAVAERLWKLGRVPLVICDRVTFDDGLIALKPRFDGVVRAKFVHFDPTRAEVTVERRRLAKVAVAEGCDAIIGMGDETTRALAGEVARRIGLPYLPVQVTPHLPRRAMDGSAGGWQSLRS